MSRGTLADADLILVMEAGRVVERGGHDELLALRGQYHALVRGQTEPAPSRTVPG